MAENLHLPLALDQLFDIAIGLADRFLLELKVPGTPAADNLNNQKHHHEHCNDQKRKHWLNTSIITKVPTTVIPEESICTTLLLNASRNVSTSLV
mgnify:CR=1 FL=1